ncbi:hypothetical protein, partial [Zobellella endophytica]|uniref:hypothetical protein n=1 Tax=Zobellella endophytica TaxID=2116700 RepID=UPI001B3013CB
AVSVDAHYRQPRFLRKGFLVKNISFGPICLYPKQKHSLGTGLRTTPLVFSGKFLKMTYHPYRTGNNQDDFIEQL